MRRLRPHRLEGASNWWHFDSDAEMATAIADTLVSLLSETLETRGMATLAASSGRSPRALYQVLAEEHKSSVDWTRVTVVQMDEYLGVPTTDPRSNAYQLQSELCEPLRVNQLLTFNGPKGRMRSSPDAYERVIVELGGIDVIVHGIGVNGHLGFNEPCTAFDSPTRQVALAPSTVARARYPGLPTEGFTLGLAVLQAARTAVVIASGSEKQAAIRALMYDAKTIDWPVTALQVHGRCLVFTTDMSFDD